MALLKWQRVIRLLLVSHFIDTVSTQTDNTAPCPYNATGDVPPVQALHEWNYLGCYYDETSNRILNSTMFWGPSNNTVPRCADFCGGYAFFGVEFGAQCFCGVSLGVAANTKPTSDAHCNYTCCGDRTISCGGPKYINIYEAIEPSPTQSATINNPSSTQASSAASGEESKGVSHGNNNSNASNNIALGLGIGFGIPMFIIATVTLGLKCSGRRRKRRTDKTTPAISRKATEASSVDSKCELDSVTALQRQKSDGSVPGHQS